MGLLFTMTAFAQIDGETTYNFNIPYTPPNPVVTPVSTITPAPVVIPPPTLPSAGSIPPNYGSPTPPPSNGGGSGIPPGGSGIPPGGSGIPPGGSGSYPPGGYTPPPPPPTPPIQGGGSSGGSYAGQNPTPPTTGSGTPPSPPAVPQVDPCTKIRSELLNTNFSLNLNALRGKTGLKNETGFSQSKNGPFTALSVAASDATSDGLNLPSDPNNIGYMHTHIDDYETGQSNADGDPEIRKTIKTFSPPDIVAFLNLLRNAQTNNIPISNVYGIVVSSKGAYELKFYGGIESVLNSTFVSNSASLLAYDRAIKSYGLENGLLVFLRDTVGISGIGLFKLERDGRVTRKIYGNGSNAIDQPCN